MEGRDAKGRMEAMPMEERKEGRKGCRRKEGSDADGRKEAMPKEGRKDGWKEVMPMEGRKEGRDADGRDANRRK